ncbi:MAG: helix-turn-helix domain-containing protein [Synechococcales cyanobacterium M58_A2018_015]|nr:helix-turn-helix domain-containing protein [Synechococcales cyanobacterium M58_A2018_015]
MSSPPLRGFLTPEPDRTLLELRTATHVPQRTTDRAEVLRLSHRGWKVDKIAAYFGWSIPTVRAAIYRWQRQELGGLWDAPRLGRRPKWQAADCAHIEATVEQDPKTHGSAQWTEQLEQQRQVRLSCYQVQRILKKRALAGNGLASAINSCKTPSHG